MKNVSIVIFTFAVFPSAWTELTVGPNNVTVQVNRSTYMNCSTTSEKGVKWLHNGVTVCAGLGCFDPYKQRFHVEKITTGSWNLIISSVKAGDRGDYRCEEIGFDAHQKSAHLTVLELEEKETADSKSTVGLPHTAAAYDTDTNAATVVTTASGTIAAIVCSIVGIVVLIIIIVYVVRKCRKTYEPQQHQPSTPNEHQQLISVPAVPNGPTASNERQQLTEDGVYFDQPILIKTIKTKIADENNSSVRALAVFNKEVYVATDNSSEIDVYDVVNLDFSRHFTVDRLINPLDIKPCLVNKCLYIFDCEYVGQPGKIVKIDHEGNILQRAWPMEDSGARMSVASNGNVIVSLWTSNKIVEYKSDGTKVREIVLPAPRHAILLETRQDLVLISQGHSDNDELHRVFQLILEDSVSDVTVDQNDARIIKTVGGEKGSSVDEMNVPWYMAVDDNGFILVAERENQRVTLFSPTLEFKKILISENDGLRRPLNMFMDIPSGRLFVTDFKWKQTERVDGRLLVFQIRNPANPQE